MNAKVTVVDTYKPMKARLIVTRACNRQCAGCCNWNIGKGIIPEPRRVELLEDLMRYEEVMITGGEPVLVPFLAHGIAANLRARNYTGRILLYSATFERDFYERIAPYIDGIHFTLHAEATSRDIFDFMAFQDWATHRGEVRGPKVSYHPVNPLSVRAYIDPRVQGEVVIRPSVFKRLEVKPWIDEGECPLPEGEELLQWGGKGTW